MAEAIQNMTREKRIILAIERSLPMLPSEAASIVKSMLEPRNVALVLGALVVWAGSHFVGIGEIFDVILLATGIIVLGFSVIDGAGELLDFTTAAMRATSDKHIDDAAHHFAKAVDILGISIVSAVLLRRSARPVWNRGVPKDSPMPKLGTAPLKTIITRPRRLAGGSVGETDMWGNIAVARNQSFTEQRLTLYHEWVHSVLSPKFSVLRRFRAQFRLNAYKKSGLIRYLEEALAESYAQLKVQGMRKAITGFSFPITHGYLTVSELAAEGVAIGNVIVSGTVYRVYLNNRPWEKAIK